MTSGDSYSRWYDKVVEDVGNKTKCVDNTLLWADTIEESYFQAIQRLIVCDHVTSLTSGPGFGLVNQVAYAFSRAERMQPFQKLLQSGVRFGWSPE